jgi:hypothetical protein
MFIRRLVNYNNHRLLLIYVLKSCIEYNISSDINCTSMSFLTVTVVVFKVPATKGSRQRHLPLAPFISLQLLA